MKYLLKYITIVLVVIPLLCSCDISTYEKHDKQSEQEISKQSITQQKNKIEKDYTLTHVTLLNVLQSMLITLKSDNDISKEALACIEKIDTVFAEEQVQNFFESKFTEQELQSLNKFYKSDVAIAYTAYRRDQLLMSSGFKVKKATKKLNKTEIKAIKDFSKSTLGLKYIEITKEDGIGSLTTIVIPLLSKEIQKCGINFN